MVAQGNKRIYQSLSQSLGNILAVLVAAQVPLRAKDLPCLAGDGCDISELVADGLLDAISLMFSACSADAGIEPLHGVVSKTTVYRLIYSFTKPLLPLLRWLFPNQLVTSEKLGCAMLHVAKFGSPKPILESADINAMQI